MSTMIYKGWTIHIESDSVTATKDGEELTIRKFGMAERGLELIKNAINKREENDYPTDR